MDGRPGTPYPEMPMPRPCCTDRPPVAEPCPICGPLSSPTPARWEAAEAILRERPDLAQVLVADLPGDRYWVIRADDATYRRVHEVVERVSPSHK